ncbi:MAG TPA: YcfL family protein, partial [Verrucomicrobiae bacterium]|nr:YcfL family protein [Verrucomicrobiae bacterium]
VCQRRLDDTAKFMKRTFAFLTLGLMTLGGILLTGCQTHDTGAYIPVNTMVNDQENHQLIVLLDSQVQYSVTCSGIQQRTTPDGRLEVTANIRNRENRRIQVQVNCVFKDEQGFPTEGDDAPFQNLFLDENAQQSVHFVSMNNRAKRYTIRIRQAR